MKPTMSLGLAFASLLSLVLSGPIGETISTSEAYVETTTGQATEAPTQARYGAPGAYVPPPPPPPPPPQAGYPAPYPGGGPTAFGNTGTAYHAPPEVPLQVLKTDIDCQKTFMNVYFKFSRPFTGYIYPYGFFDKCILFVGRGETDVKLTLSQDICGAPPPAKIPGYSQRTDPLIEHRLMIQWDTDLVQEYDTNVLVRCDRPDDYNRTIKFDLSSVVGENQQAIVKTHPGPKLWMEIQDGEGPTSPPLLGPVFLGQTLSLVFTLADDVFNFDSNVLHCWATDGKTERALVPVYDPNQGGLPQRPLLTQLQVIENSCSVKPKLFGNFQKMRDSYGSMKQTTEWVLFKAFRFPTTSRVLIQCDLQVCFEKCYPQKPCELPYDARSARKRRSAGNTTTSSSSSSDSNAVQPEMLTMYRAIEVFLPNDDSALPSAVVNGSTEMISRMLMPRTDCLSSSTFYGVILGLGIALLILIGVVATYIQRQNKKNRTPK